MIRRLPPYRGGLPFGGIANRGGLAPRLVRGIDRLVIRNRQNPSRQPE
jgi:hypothetical protein